MMDQLGRDRIMITQHNYQRYLVIWLVCGFIIGVCTVINLLLWILDDEVIKQIFNNLF